jgi:oxygen-dependent protoporphyrinogen oxidase
VTGVAHEPLAHTITRWERGLPQYRVGHTLRIDTAFVRLNRHPRLALAGAGYRGSGLPDVAKGAIRAGRKVTAALAERAH